MLPIGSLIKLKEENKKMLIIGYYLEYKGVIYDYVAVPYPEGYIDESHYFVFNEEQIEKIIYQGFVSDKYICYMKFLKKAQNGEIV